MAKLRANSLSKAANDSPQKTLKVHKDTLGHMNYSLALLPPDVNKDSVKMMQAHGQYDSRATYM